MGKRSIFFRALRCMVVVLLVHFSFSYVSGEFNPMVWGVEIRLGEMAISAVLCFWIERHGYY